LENIISKKSKNSRISRHILFLILGLFLGGVNQQSQASHTSQGQAYAVGSVVLSSIIAAFILYSIVMLVRDIYLLIRKSKGKTNLEDTNTPIKKIDIVPHKKKRGKNHQYLYISIFLAICISIFIFTDYYHYEHGNKSIFFGTIDTYKQNQTMHFNMFDIWVTQVERRDYPPVILIHCTDLPLKPIGYIPTNGLNIPGFTEPNKWQQDCYSYYKSDSNYSEYIKSTSLKNLIVHFYYKNTSNNVASLNGYNFKLIANTKITEKDRKITGGYVLPKSQTYANISIDIDKNYNGQLNLLVTNNNVAKSIELNIPTQVKYWP